MECLSRDHPHFPSGLQHAKPPPEQLYIEGQVVALGKPTVGVIGSRRMSEYGSLVLNRILPPLVRAGLAVVSGLAYGVDAEAHRVTLAHQGTAVAVLGSSLDRVYPQAHWGLARRITGQGGALVSEYPPGTPGYKGHFPARNRLIAALSQVLLIIEAADPSGTFSTARAALDLGKEVCVVPADITREQSNGTLRLLKEGARPVSSAEDIIPLYQQTLPFQVTQQLRPALTGSPATLYGCISRGVATADQLARETGWPISQVQAALTVLELDGYITLSYSQWQIIS